MLWFGNMETSGKILDKLSFGMLLGHFNKNTNSQFSCEYSWEISRTNVRCNSNNNDLLSQVGQKLKKMYEKYESLAVHKIEERLTFDETTLPEKRCPTICYFRNMCDEPWHSHKQKYLQNLLLDSYGFAVYSFLLILNCNSSCSK